MPSPLRIFGKDPNDLGRGRGLYYLRGHGYFSKYNPFRDAKIKAKGWRIHKIGLPRSTSIPHAGDGRLPR